MQSLRSITRNARHVVWDRNRIIIVIVIIIIIHVPPTKLNQTWYIVWRHTKSKINKNTSNNNNDTYWLSHAAVAAAAAATTICIKIDKKSISHSSFSALELYLFILSMLYIYLDMYLRYTHIYKIRYIHIYLFLFIRQLQQSILYTYQNKFTCWKTGLFINHILRWCVCWFGVHLLTWYNNFFSYLIDYVSSAYIW